MPDNNSPADSAVHAKKSLRSQIRKQRRSLSAREQRIAGQKLAGLLSRQLFFLRARHLAFYLPNDGEIDPVFLLELAVAAGKQVYLPLLHPISHKSMVFVRWRPGDALIPNRYGIPEPRWQPGLPPWLLDIVFMPLVAFDNRGNRLGMGGGFYDRTFARGFAKPSLIGMAHHFQHTSSLPAEPWDVPLDAIATDTALTFFNQPIPPTGTP